MKAFLLAQAMSDQQYGHEGPGILPNLFALLIVAVVFGSLWKIFTKAGEPGWAAIVPIYNAIIILKIVGRPIWWIALLLIPCVGWIVGIIVAVDLAKAFGKSVGFAVGMILLPIVFYPMLAFGDAQYGGKKTAGV